MFGKVAACVEAIADAFKIVKGFFPVNVVCPLLFEGLSGPLMLPADFAPAP